MRRFDIRARPWSAWLAAAGSAALLLPAAGQLLDETLDEVVDRQVTEQVEEDVAEALQEVVEEQVEDDITEQVQTSVTGAVEELIEAEVVNAVQEQVESGVVDAVQQQVESGVVSTIAEQLESSVAGEIGEQILDSVDAELGGLADELGETVRAAEGAVGGSEAAEGASPTERTERFEADVDALGRSLERNVWIILVPTEHAEQIPTWGFTIRERQDLATLDRVLLRVAAPEDREIAQAALELALQAPGTEVDFNHVYRPGAQDGADDTVTGRPAVERNDAQPSPAAALSVGIVDTAVATEHEALRAADIVQRDFVPFAAERPTAHGTAVASILVGEAAKLRPQLRGGRVYAASVFFEDADGNDASTAASLAAAGEWLATQGVRVINMSLAGPPNRVLEGAIAALAKHGVIVVAAVGNNGPTGAPLYPAAYAQVVGVTAIDSANRIYRYANRGAHVSFAAPGVGVRVARSGPGYRELSGTSFAAPHAAAAIARSVAVRNASAPAAVLAELQSTAKDLGAKNFDDVFGFGLIEALEAAPVTASR